MATAIIGKSVTGLYRPLLFKSRPWFETLETKFGNLGANEKLWDDNATAWNKIVGAGGNRFHQAFLYPAVMAFVGSTQGKDVLDLGCGEGAFCRAFAQTANQVTGVDISEKMLRAARRKKGGNERYLHRSFTKLHGIKDASQDLAFSNMAFMSAPGMKDFFSEAYRVLRPGGQFVFVIKHPFTLWQQHQKAEPSAGYFDESPFERKTDLAVYSQTAGKKLPQGEITSVHYPRTISTYLNGLKEAGFQFDAMEEPCPTPEAMQDVPELKPLSLQPGLLMIRAIKPKLSLVG